MPRYYFHVADGHDMPDDHGQELATMREAQLAAIRYAGALMQDDPAAFWKEHDWTMRVADEDGLTCFTLHFLTTISPSMQGSGN